jgi:hypothetical protein
VTRLSLGTALFLGLALAAYPFALAPAYPNVTPLASLSIVLLAAAMTWRGPLLVAATACVLIAEYAIALLTGRGSPDPMAAVFGTILVLMIELFDIGSLVDADVVDVLGVRRRLTHAITLSVFSCILALVVALAGLSGYVVPGWFLFVSAACGAGVLVTLSALAARALQHEGAPRPD